MTADMAAINDAAGPVQRDAVPGDDLSALSWVRDELRRSLELAAKALRRYLKEQSQRSDLDTVDPGVLRQARTQLHQSVGVLELVGFGPAAELLRAAEAALQRLSARPKLITVAAVDTLERGSFALLEFIDRRLAGKPVSSLALFPQYRALQELAGATRVHPADLWEQPWSWRELALDPAVPPCHPDAGTTGQIEADLLALMRGVATGHRRPHLLGRGHTPARLRHPGRIEAAQPGLLVIDPAVGRQGITPTHRGQARPQQAAVARPGLAAEEQQVMRQPL